MNQRTTLGVLVASVALGIGVHAATAGPVTWQFAGQISRIDDDLNILKGAVDVGTPFFVSFTFESSTVDSRPDNPSFGEFDDAILDISGTLGDSDFLGPSALGNTIAVINDDILTGGDGFSFILIDADTDLFGETSDVFLTLRDSTGAVFSTDSLPHSPPDLNLFDTARFAVSTASERLDLEGTVTSLTPEPATIFLLALGAFVALRRGSRVAHAHSQSYCCPRLLL